MKIPDSLSWEEAGCIQPLAVAVQVRILLPVFGPLSDLVASWLDVLVLPLAKHWQSCKASHVS